MLIASDLLLSEHRETADPEAFTFDVPIDRGELITDGVPPDYKRYRFTESGVSPRVLPGYEGRRMSPPATSMTSRGSDQR